MTESMRQAVRWVIHGRVQGVWFRAFTQERALALGLGGWVRNLPDGTVEARVAGEPATLTAFKQQLHQGPPLSQVREITEEVLAEDAAAELPAGTFEIRH
jgi:acylphosphatase